MSKQRVFDTISTEEMGLIVSLADMISTKLSFLNITYLRAHHGINKVPAQIKQRNLKLALEEGLEMVPDESYLETRSKVCSILSIRANAARNRKPLPKKKSPSRWTPQKLRSLAPELEKKLQDEAEKKAKKEARIKFEKQPSTGTQICMPEILDTGTFMLDCPRKKRRHHAGCW